MIELLRITESIHPLYKQFFSLYEASFPHCERRSPLMQKSILSSPAYHLDVILRGHSFSGFVAYWELKCGGYIEHLAVCPELRGMSVGTMAMEIFCKTHSRTVLEIEPPVDDLSLRRLAFYERLGFLLNNVNYIHPSYQRPYQPHRLVLMSHPEILTPQDYDQFIFLRDSITLAGRQDDRQPIVPCDDSVTQ